MNHFFRLLSLFFQLSLTFEVVFILEVVFIFWGHLHFQDCLHFCGCLHFWGHFQFGGHLHFWGNLYFWVRLLDLLNEYTKFTFYSIQIQLEIPEIELLSVVLKKDKNSFRTKNSFGPKFFLNQLFFWMFIVRKYFQSR